MSLHLEDKDTQEFVVNVNTNNTKPDRGYEIGAADFQSGENKITGPVSLINKIDKDKCFHRCRWSNGRCDSGDRCQDH